MLFSSYKRSFQQHIPLCHPFFPNHSPLYAVIRLLEGRYYRYVINISINILFTHNNNAMLLSSLLLLLLYIIIVINIIILIIHLD